ncbi:hypothetical protein ACEPAG_3747 [Sanghuangporus baumii]
MEVDEQATSVSARDGGDGGVSTTSPEVAPGDPPSTPSGAGPEVVSSSAAASGGSVVPSATSNRQTALSATINETEPPRAVMSNSENAPQEQIPQFTFSTRRNEVPPQVRFSIPPVIPSVIPLARPVEDNLSHRPDKYFKSAGGRTALMTIGEDHLVMERRQVLEEQNRARALEKELEASQRQLQDIKRQLLQGEEMRARRLEAQVSRTQARLAENRQAPATQPSEQTDSGTNKTQLRRARYNFEKEVKPTEDGWPAEWNVPVPKKTPRRKTKQHKSLCALVRYAFKEKFPKTPSEAAFERHVPANPEDVDDYEVGEHPGPVEGDLRIDVFSGRSSSWNQRVVGILYESILRKMEVEELPDDQDREFRSLICKKLTRAQSYCRAAVPKPLRDGRLETEDEVIARRYAQKKQTAKSNRHTMRRHTIFKQRSQTCETKLLLLPPPERNISIWKFLYNVLMTYGPDGMSSDESDDANTRKKTYHVKVLAWRRDIDKYMDFIDDCYQEVASKQRFPGRIDRRRDHKFASNRGAKTGLPRSFYNEMWLNGPTPQQAMIMKAVSEETFKWLPIFEVDENY